MGPKPGYAEDMTIDELGDADGHLIEPGDLWAERMPKDLRPMAPRWFRDEEGVFHQEIYGLDIGTLEVMHGGMSPRDMLQNMGLAAAMGQDLARVFTVVDRDRSKGLYFVRYGDPETAAKKDEGILAKLKFWKDTTEKPEQYQIVIAEAAQTSVVSVQDPGGSPDRTATSEKILALLKDQLK